MTRTTTMDENKKRALSAALTQIEKQYGKGSVMRMGDRVAEVVPVIPTGSLLLDNALGIGGLPRGRVIEVYGPESSGKTTLTLQTIAQCQKLGGVCAFIDAEHALDPTYASKLGVNVEDLLVSQPDTGEQALEIADMLVRSNAVDMVVVDSVAALTPRAEIEGEMGDQLPGLQARLMSQALRKLTGNIKRSNCMVFFINQLRHKIAIMIPGQSPETTSGGNALKFYATVRLSIRRIGPPTTGDKKTAHHARRDRRRDGRPAARPAGTPDEPGAAQADRQHQAQQLHGVLHQPAAAQDRHHDARPESGNHQRRQRAEVLCLGAPGHPSHRRGQEGRRDHRQPDQDQGGQEQDRKSCRERVCQYV